MTAKTSGPAGAAGAAPTDAMGNELEGLLAALLSEHEGLLGLAGEHRAAIGAADPAALSACVKRQNEAVQKIAELETRRLALAARMGGVEPGPARARGAPAAARVIGTIAERPTVTRL